MPDDTGEPEPLPAEEGGDPIRSDDPEVLRAEILRLRELIAAQELELGERQGRIAEMAGTLHQYEGLGEAYDQLAARHERLSSLWPLRAARAVLGPVRRLRHPS